jgi:hypothetical protein
MDIVRLQWMRVENIVEDDLFNKCRVFKRAGHSSIAYKDNLYIFGGNNFMFIGSDLFNLNLNLAKRKE